jgi:hypothetical protein
MHKQHIKAAQHQADVEKHGDEAMGFPHDKTTHHFHLLTDGGAIEGHPRRAGNPLASGTYCHVVLERQLLPTDVHP